MTPTTAIPGKGVFGRSRFGGKQLGISEATFAQDLYRLEVWTNAGVRKAVLPNWGSAKWTQTANRPSLLQFTYPFEDEHKDLLVYPNQIRLYDRFNKHIDTLTIVVVTPTRTSDGNLIAAIECDGLMAQLASDIVTYDSVTDGDTTVITILDALFALQTRTNIEHIRRGSIHSSIRTKSAISVFENRSILQALHDIQSTIGGYMEVTPTGTFRWQRETGRRTGQQIRDNKNLQAVNVQYDYRNIYTRVTAYGQGASSGTRASVTVNNASAQSTYGIIPLTISFSDISNTTELTARATKKLREVSRPGKRVSFNAIDLSMATDSRLDFDHESLAIGSRISIVDNKIGETHNTRIAHIARDLFNPMGVTLEVQNPDDFNETTALAEREPDILDDILDMEDVLTNETIRDTGKLDIPTLLAAVNPPGGTPLIDDFVIWDEAGNAGNMPTKLVDVLSVDTGAIISTDPAQDVVVDDSGDPGDNDTLSDSGHIHNLDSSALVSALIGTGTPEAVGPSGVQGNASDAAPFNHVHGTISASASDIKDVGTTAAAGSSGKVADASHIHVGGNVIINASEPAAGSWPQGWLWIDTGTAHGAFYQVWIKTKSSGANNDSKVAIALFE